MTGPVQTAAVHRDTKVVVADLFRRAETSVVIAGYAIHQGRQIFSDLAARMKDLAALNVRLYLNLTLKPGDNRDDPERISKSASEFVERHWPSNHRLPEIYYDRRGLRPNPEEPFSFHAKCVIRDRKELFISSANFTEAAQNRNIEMGVLLVSPALANQAFNFFADLVREGICMRAL
jgi:phosphatidylserine/phosphatidylglycerophosphate/cardiolipin synthase-like enzyme